MENRDSRVNLVNVSALKCPKCSYNLTGLTREICPECGSAFNLELMRDDPERHRLGSPVYRTRRLAIVSGTLKTILLMLFRPISFAQRLRLDESLFPPLAVFLLVVISVFLRLYGFSFANTPSLFFARVAPRMAVWVAESSLLILVFAFVLAAVAKRGNSFLWTFLRRFRFWIIVGLYSTVFLPFWPRFCAGAWPLPWRKYTTDWPFVHLHFSNNAYAASIVLLWWTTIICIVLWYRNRPRWLAIIMMLGAFLFARAAIQIVDDVIPRLSRS